MMLCDADKITEIRKVMTGWDESIARALTQHKAQEISDNELECHLAMYSAQTRISIKILLGLDASINTVTGANSRDLCDAVDTLVNKLATPN